MDPHQHSPHTYPFKMPQNRNELTLEVCCWKMVSSFRHLGVLVIGWTTRITFLCMRPQVSFSVCPCIETTTPQYPHTEPSSDLPGRTLGNRENIQPTDQHHRYPSCVNKSETPETWQFIPPTLKNPHRMQSLTYCFGQSESTG